MSVADDVLDSENTNLLDLTDCWGRKVTPGTRVRIADRQHPHYSRIGTYRGVDVLAAASPGAKVTFEDGGGCYIFKAHQWECFEQAPAHKRKRIW